MKRDIFSFIAGLSLLPVALFFLFQYRAASQLPEWFNGLRNAKLVKDLQYVPGDRTESHRLDLGLPMSSAGPIPVIVWIHGGAWYLGDKTDCPGGDLIANGYAVATINYRLSQEAKFPAQIYDCKAAIRWLRAHAADYNLDPKRIGVWGASAGGHLALLLGTTCGVAPLEGDEGDIDYSSCPNAVCDWSGPTDLFALAAEQGEDPEIVFGKPDSPEVRLVDANKGDVKQMLAKASPIAYVQKDVPPILIMHGDKDNVVPIAQSEDFYQALKNVGADARFVVVKGMGHRLYSRDAMDNVLEFFKQKLD